MEKLSFNANSQTLIMCSLDDLRTIVTEAIQDAANKFKEAAEADELLTVDEVSNLLQVDRSTLWRWHRDEYLVPQKVGKRSLYRKSDINKLIKK